MNKTQVLKRIRLYQFTTETLVEDNYPNEKIRHDDDIVSPQDDLYSLDRKWKSNPHSQITIEDTVIL